MLFHVYVTTPHNPLSGWNPERSPDDLETAFNHAFKRVAEIGPECRVWIEAIGNSTHDKIQIMN